MKNSIIDISNDTHTHYRIQKPGNFIYFFKNRNGNLTFEILHEHTFLTIYGIYEGFRGERFSLQTKQLHNTPNSSSHLTVKSVLWDNASLEHQGNIEIQTQGDGTKAFFESRHLLMGDTSQALAKPQLEILAQDVICSHAVATSPPNKDLLHFLLSRGISPQEGRKLIASGFLADIPTEKSSNNHQAK